MNAARTRVISNYARLASGFACGLLSVRLLLGLGPEAYGVLVLLALAQGVAASVRETITSSMLPHLAAAIHSHDPRRVRQASGVCWRVALAGAAFSAVVFAAFRLALPSLNAPPDLRPAASWFLLFKCVETSAAIACSPLQAFCLARERMVALNGWISLERCVDTFAAAASLLLAMWSAVGPSGAICWYGGVSATAMLSLHAAFCCYLTRAVDRPMAVTLRCDGEAARSFLNDFRPTAIVGLATNLYSRADLLVMNLFFGVHGTLVFGIANQLAYYTRQFAMGAAMGVDAVAARLLGKSDSTQLAEMAHRSTAMQGYIVLPLAAVILTQPTMILDGWLGDRLSDSPDLTASCATLAQLLAVGVGARAIAECWLKTLTGIAGASAMSRPVVIAAVLNPVLAVLAVVAAPPRLGMLAPAAVLAVVLAAVYLVLLPRALADRLGVSWGRMYRPLVGPALALTVSSPLLFSAASMTSRTAVCGCLIGFGCCFAAAGLLAGHDAWSKACAGTRRLQHQLRYLVGNHDDRGHCIRPPVEDAEPGRPGGGLEEPAACNRPQTPQRPAA